MKLSKRSVSIIVVVGMVVGAGAVGWLIHWVQTGPRSSADAGRQQQLAMTLPGPGQRQAGDTPEQRARQKERRAQTLEKMKSLTEEEKAEFREQIRRQFGQRVTRAPVPAEQALPPSPVPKESAAEVAPAQAVDANAGSEPAAGTVPAEPNQGVQR